MTDYLPQAEADFLFKMEKIKESDSQYNYPELGGRGISIPLSSQNRRESFLLDISRGRIALISKYQLRGRQTIVLARLDFNAPHRNPDDTEIGVPHLHLYKEGFADRWAFPIPEGMLKNPNNQAQSLHDFMDFCHIIDRPNIYMGLFI